MKHTMRAVLALLLAAPSLGGCSAPAYKMGFAYAPHPSEAVLRDTATDATVGRMLVSVAGVTNANPAMGVPAGVDVRLRLENLGAEPMTLDPKAVALVGGNLQSFPPPITIPTRPFTVPPGESAIAQAIFPLPGGTTKSADLDGLHVQWSVTTRSGDVPGTANFDRKPRPKVRYVYRDFGFSHARRPWYAYPLCR